MLPSERAETLTVPPVLKITNDASIPFILRSSSAACAAITLICGEDALHTDTAHFLYSCAAEIISLRSLYADILSAKSFLTLTVSAPAPLRYAAVSNVATPERRTKFFVSSIIPERSASATTEPIFIFCGRYCIICVTSSEADEADGS